MIMRDKDKIYERHKQRVSEIKPYVLPQNFTNEGR